MRKTIRAVVPAISLAVLAVLAIGLFVIRGCGTPSRERQQLITTPQGIPAAKGSPAPVKGASHTDEFLSSLRAEVLRGPHGSAPIAEVVTALADISGGPEIQDVFQVLAVRKQEALPVVKEKLRTGEMFEKHMMTKLLRYSPWPETYPELVELAKDPKEHWLPRQGALYALGALGNKEAGPAVLSILKQENCPSGVKLVAISTLGRIGYREAATAIRSFCDHEDMHTRLFACRALAGFGEPVDKQFMLSALNDEDYMIREEACGALTSVEGGDVNAKLKFMAEQDSNESVRVGARIALLERQIGNQASDIKLNILSNSLGNADRRTRIWIIQAILEQCGAVGQAFVEELAAREDTMGERARAFLVLNAKQAKP